jgi:hypothetical protein
MAKEATRNHFHAWNIWYPEVNDCTYGTLKMKTLEQLLAEAKEKLRPKDNLVKIKEPDTPEPAWISGGLAKEEGQYG